MKLHNKLMCGMLLIYACAVPLALSSDAYAQSYPKASKQHTYPKAAKKTGAQDPASDFKNHGQPAQSNVNNSNGQRPSSANADHMIYDRYASSAMPWCDMYDSLKKSGFDEYDDRSLDVNYNRVVSLYLCLERDYMCVKQNVEIGGDLSPKVDALAKKWMKTLPEIISLMEKEFVKRDVPYKKFSELRAEYLERVH